MTAPHSLDCPGCAAREWVAQVLRRYATMGGGVCIANVDELASVLVDELQLEEWFRGWVAPADSPT